MIVVFIIVFLALGIGYVIGYERARRLAKSKPRLYVEVGQSQHYGEPLQHMVSARIIDRETNKTVHFERVDLRAYDYEDQLALALWEVKRKLRHLEAAQLIARE